MGWRYLAFGLLIDTFIHLPEALPADQDAPVEVTIKNVEYDGGLLQDPGFVETRERRSWWQGMPDENHMLFNCPSGLYEIKNGNVVNIDLYPDADMEQAKIYLLGSAMGAVQSQRGRIPVHGGAVASSKGALIITGGQGAGKSTMTSAFVYNGYKYLTDDVSSIGFDNGRAKVVPAYPQRKLVRDACLPLGYEPDEMVLVDAGRDKFAVRDRENWRCEDMDLGVIIELYPAGAGEGVSVAPVVGKEKLDCVIRNLYRMWMLTPGGAIKPEAFKKVLMIAAQAEIYKVGVTRDINNIGGIAFEIADSLSIAPGE